MIYSKPQCATGTFTVGTALEKLTAFNAVYEAGKNGSVANNCQFSENEKAAWRNAIREGVILCGGEPSELDFFEKMNGAKTNAMEIDATDLYIKYKCDRDYNIYSVESVVGASPGGSRTFTLLKSNHSMNGKYSNVAVNGNIYVYEDRQWLQITAVDTTVDFAHVVTVVPNSKDYTVKINAGKKMMFSPVRFIDGYSCPAPSSTWESPGFIKKVSPFRIRKDWETPYELNRPYQDILQWAVAFDHQGNEIDQWTTADALSAHEEMMSMRNLIFFLGQKKDNPALVGTAQQTKYSGFDGYLPSLRYGGGVLYDIDPGVGFDLDSDFQAIIQHQDATKRTKEFFGMHGINFGFGMTRNFNQNVKNYSGACTFDTFKRMGATQEDIVRMGVQSMKWNNYTLHWKEISAWSDTRYIGNYDFPNMAILQPGNGLRDSKNRAVPAIEFYSPTGGETMMESIVDHWKTDQCEKLSGSIIEELMMATHCPSQHILINPIM